MKNTLKNRSRTHLGAFCAIVIAAGLLSGQASANPIFFGFESSEPVQPSGKTGELMCSGNCPTISTDVKRSGTRSVKSVINRLNSTDMYRAELSHLIDMDVNKGASTTEYWSGFSVYIPGPYPAMTNPVYEIVYQLHTRPPDGNWSGYNGMNPPLALFLRPATDTTGNFAVWIKGTNESYPQTSNVTTFNANVKPYNTNRWYDFVVNTRLDSTSSGVTKIWIDGELVVNYSGMNYFRGHGTAYPKFGFYNGWRTRDIPGEKVSVRTIYHDEYRFGYGAGVGFSTVSPSGQPPAGNALDAPGGLRVITE